MQKEAEKFADSDLLEGFFSIQALLQAKDEGINDRPVFEILFAQEKKQKKEREWRFLWKYSKKYGFPIRLCPLCEIESLAVGSTHGGILARCGNRSFPSVSKEILQQNPKGFYVLLDGIEDPYNFGYALRTLYAAGADGILLSPRNWMGAAGVVCRASAGASERFCMYLCDRIEQGVDCFKESGYRIVCADLDRAVSVYDADLSFPLLLIIGGEKRGIRASVLEKADTVVRLEYGRPFDAALSAASAASLLGYEVFRYNRN